MLILIVGEGEGEYGTYLGYGTLYFGSCGVLGRL